ncbi:MULTISPECIES: cation:proton antiporter domain-containing protein [unclassified Modestobacter]|uniref:cation:proton antiporter domain-containing protein n=1 Tax=unclassified Modestobacter TaxID=2643866 RepID=UPI0022AA6989|nr:MULTISPECIES: cation:proton antiporter [unclassified Modestobacter]MCZ2825010.1 cation:proton antiporter [Modestobacter sp. VKM Ac-2981]MCZ2854487.1 cation:proton antiporter [Modestobacter sp. VKM Ac-2982]
MEDLHLGYALVGSLAVALAALSSKMRDLPFSEPLLALLLGVVVGPQVLGLVEISEGIQTPLVHELARVLLAISLIGVALRFPVRRLRPIVTPTTVLVTVGMLGMAALSAGLAWLVLGVPLALAVLIGVCLTPTDPVLASSVVTGKPAEEHLPARTRQLLSEESGTNDGLALPLVLLGIALVLGDSLGHAALDGLYQVVVGVVVGIVVGLVAGRAMSFAQSRSDVDEGPSLIFTLVLAVAVLGIARVANSDGILSVFVAGLAYNFTVSQDDVGPQNTIDEGVNRYVVLPLFLLLGILLPWSEWADLGWAALVFPVAVLLLRRPPVLLALARPLGLELRDAVFLGWFGPIGVSALFYLTLSEEHGVTDPRLWAAGTLVVAASTFAHGVSSAPGRRLYRRAAGS